MLIMNIDQFFDLQTDNLIYMQVRKKEKKIRKKL